MKRPIYVVEVGVLLAPDDKEFDAYSHCYDGKHGYYDEALFYVDGYLKACLEALDYAERGVEGTYGIVSGYGLCEETELNPETDLVEDFHALVENVEFSVMKKDGKLIHDFIVKGGVTPC